ncbi:MAG: hypothetical protein Q8Q06_01150 [bacterium]|nr:hypothetical protein [bacterium]
MASFRDKKQAGRNESNSKMTLFFEDGTFEEVSLLDRMEHYKYVAASVCHQHEIEHDESICILWDELFKDGSLTDKERYPI